MLAILNTVRVAVLNLSAIITPKTLSVTKAFTIIDLKHTYLRVCQRSRAWAVYKYLQGVEVPQLLVFSHQTHTGNQQEQLSNSRFVRSTTTSYHYCEWRTPRFRGQRHIMRHNLDMRQKLPSFGYHGHVCRSVIIFIRFCLNLHGFICLSPRTPCGPNFSMSMFNSHKTFGLAGRYWVLRVAYYGPSSYLPGLVKFTNPLVSPRSWIPRPHRWSFASFLNTVITWQPLWLA